MCGKHKKIVHFDPILPVHLRCNWFMHFQCVQGPSLGLFTRFSFRFGLHFHVSFVLNCCKKCLTGVAVWRSVLLKSCLSNLFLGRWLHSFGKVMFSGTRSTARAKFWYRPYHFVQLRPQLSKYRSKVSILFSLDFSFCS